jgi:nucleoside-diphosphate-sugar epimerase
VPVDLITRFVEQALRGEPLEILGEHRFERLDIRDAVQALLKLLEVPHREWEAVYNLGRGEAFSLRDLAETVLAQVDPLPGAAPSRIVTRIQDPPLAIGMDSTRFFQLTGWQPEYALDDTVRSLASYLRNRAEHQRKEG